MKLSISKQLRIRAAIDPKMKWAIELERYIVSSFLAFGEYSDFNACDSETSETFLLLIAEALEDF